MERQATRKSLRLQRALGASLGLAAWEDSHRGPVTQRRVVPRVSAFYIHSVNTHLARPCSCVLQSNVNIYSSPAQMVCNVALVYLFSQYLDATVTFL